MAKNVIINGVTYNSVPEVRVPTTDSSTAIFYDTSDATAAQANVLTGASAYVASGKISGTMPNNGAVSGDISTVNGTVSVAAGYTTGGSVGIASAEREKVVSGNIKSGVSILGVNGGATVKDVSVGTTATTASVLNGYKFYDASGTLSTGAATVPTISQDSTTKVLSIS